VVLVAAPALGLRDRDGAEVALIIDLSRQPPQDPNPYITEYERMLWPTVRIKTGNSTGSGVIIQSNESKKSMESKGSVENDSCDSLDSKDSINYWVLTAAHVVGNSSNVTVEFFYPDSVEINALVVITDTTKDLALIRIRPNLLPPQVYSATLAPKSYQPYLFRPVYTIGCSLGLPPRPSQGIISVIEDAYWEVSSPILPGNSGGPVYDSKTFEVIGIAVWVRIYKDQLITTMAGIVPIGEIYEFLKATDYTD